MGMLRTLAFAVILTLSAYAAPAQSAAEFNSDPNEPVFTAVDMNGEMIDIRSLRGKVVVLNLWYINCPNCVAEIKLLNNLVEEYEGREVVFLAPAASTRAELVRFLAKHPFRYRVIPDAGNIILGKFGTPDKDGFRTLPFPMHIVLDRNGRLVTKAPGIKGIEAVRAELKRQFLN